MVQLIILGLAAICLIVGLLRWARPPAHLEPEEQRKYAREAVKLIVASLVAAAAGAAISFV